LTRPERDDVVGYKRPPRSTRYPSGVSGNPKGRPKRKGGGLPYARILDRMVMIKGGLVARQVTAEEAFILYLRKKALDGSEAAQERLQEIMACRRERDPNLGSDDLSTILRVIVSPDNPNYALRLLKMAEKLYRFHPHTQIKLEPWLVQRALDRLGDRRLDAAEQSNRRRRDADAYEGPMARLVGNIAFSDAAPVRRSACAIKPCRPKAAAPSGSGAAPQRSEVRIPSAPPQMRILRPDRRRPFLSSPRNKPEACR
jgi:hypothetical protein